MANPPFPATLAALIERQGLTPGQASALLGVPVYTLRKWLAGQRVPSAAAVRLVDVLLTLEALAPDMLAALAPDMLAALAPTVADVPEVAAAAGENGPL